MEGDSRLFDALTECIAKEDVCFAIETGTYLGLGSTQLVANAFLQSKPPQMFVTIEANWSSWKKAKRNLLKYGFVTVLWGKSVAEHEAVQFIKNDPCLQRHETYPDIWIDDICNPREFYIKEIQGRLGEKSSMVDQLLRKCAEPFYYSGEDLLKKYLIQFRLLKPLVVLDSAGGTGYLEFTILRTIMENDAYLVLLDDVHHLKHFRSVKEIESNNNFKILASNTDNGWLLAKHK